MGKIFCVDDEQMVLNMYHHLFSRNFSDQELITASDGQSGFEVYRPDISVILTDKDMPYASGIEMLQRIVAHYGRIPPSIICTGRPEEVAYTEAREAGAVGILLKPMNFKNLVELMKHMLTPTTLEIGKLFPGSNDAYFRENFTRYLTY